MTHAAVVEVREREHYTMSVSEWLAMAAGKTGALFGFAGFAAGALGEEPACSDAFDRACVHLGVAFQIADDLSDLSSSVSSHESYQDLFEGNPAFPSILAASRDPRVQQLLRASVRRREGLEETAAEVLRVVGPDATARALSELESARAAFGSDSTHPEVRRVLEWGTSFVLSQRLTLS